MPQLLYLLAYSTLVTIALEAQWSRLGWVGQQKAHHAVKRTSYSAILSKHNLLITLIELQGKYNKINFKKIKLKK
jgi:hypothetical protein